MNNIKEIIWDSGYRKNYIAEKMNVHPSVISMWISGSRVPSANRIKKLCKILNCKKTDLYPGGIDG